MKFELLHATLQHNNCTSSSFPVIPWPWGNIKVTQTGLKLQRKIWLRSLEQIGSQASGHRVMLIVNLIKSLGVFSLFSLAQINLAWVSLCQRTKFHPTEGQGHPNLYQNVELSNFYHLTKFEWNRPVNVWIHSSVKDVILIFTQRNHIRRVPYFENKMDKKKKNKNKKPSMNVTTLWSLKSILSSIQIDWKLYELIGAEAFACLQSCDFEWWSRPTRLVSQCGVQSINVPTLNQIDC